MTKDKALTSENPKGRCGTRVVHIGLGETALIGIEGKNGKSLVRIREKVLVSNQGNDYFLSCHFIHGVFNILLTNFSPTIRLRGAIAIIAFVGGS